MSDPTDNCAHETTVLAGSSYLKCKDCGDYLPRPKDMTHPTDKASVADRDLIGKLCVFLKNVKWSQTYWGDDAEAIIDMVRSADALLPAQGDGMTDAKEAAGMRDALVKIEDLIGAKLDTLNGAQKECAINEAWHVANTALASHPDRQPGMTDELLGLLIESQTFIGGDWRERRDAAIKRASQGER